MSAQERAPLPDGWRQTTCPDCGGELKYGEMILSSRSLQGWDKDGVLYVAHDYEDNGEAHEDEHLYCDRCLTEWALPENFDFGELEDEED